MALVTTKEMFKKAYDGGYAVGAFNVNNMEIVQGITEAAGELKSPVILQVSKGARAYANHTYLVKLVEAAVAENPDIPVFLMGHRNSDLDSIGAAVGMWAAIRKGLEKPASIVLNRGQTLAGALVDRVEEAYGQEEALFISPAEAMQSATERSLLIVVDTHSVNFVENSDLLEHIPRIVVIDHHRMMISHIKNALIFYHEPYASSASEMVTELVQYIRGSALTASMPRR